MKSKSLEDLQKKLAEFAKVRNWHKFHSPKNLSIALLTCSPSIKTL